MDNVRLLLFIFICFMTLSLYLQLVSPPRDETEATEAAPIAVEPPSVTAQTGQEPAPTQDEAAPGDLEDYDDLGPVTVETAVYRVEFDLRGARPQSWEIVDPEYGHIGAEADEGTSADVQSSYPQVIPRWPDEAQINSDELPLEVVLPRWSAEWSRDWDFNRQVWRLASGPERDEESSSVHVSFESPPRGGLVVVKEFTFFEPAQADGEELSVGDHAGGYLSEMRLTLRNVGTELVVLRDEGVGMRLTWGPGIGAYERLGMYSVRTPLALVDDDTWYKTPGENKPREIAALSAAGVSWAGLQSRYFLASIIPTGADAPAIQKVEAELRAENIPGNATDFGRFSPLMTVALLHPPLNLRPGDEQVWTYDLYVGPKHRPHLLAAGHELSRTSFYNSWFWMRGLCIGLTSVLMFFHGVLGNYGWSILLLTILLRILLYPITHRQMKIMARTQRDMARVKPFVDEVKEKYKDNFQKIQRETMNVYREHGVNPYAGLKGCLPMILQMPVFFALWRMLAASIELRGASWLWIEDLSGPDRLVELPMLESLPLIGWMLGPSINLLPILMAVTQALTMKLSPHRVDDPNQRAMMIFMPIMLTVVLYRAPSGLMLYWVAGNIWQMGHQYLTTRAVMHGSEAETAAPAATGEGAKARDHSAAKDSAKSAKDRKRRTSAKGSLAEKRQEAAKARRRSISESSSLPRWIRRGGG